LLSETVEEHSVAPCIASRAVLGRVRCHARWGFRLDPFDVVPQSSPTMTRDASRPSFFLRLGSFVRFSHTIFALPFALVAMLVAGQGRVPLALFGWILMCMVAARTAAMCFNRLVDWEIDQRNPRTADRHTLLKRSQGWSVLVAASLVAVAATSQINPLCFRLSPLMLVILFFYSLTKRFTPYSHLFLGIALGVAPLGAWAAVRGSLFDTLAPFLLALAVALWTFGFDLIYATLDAEFDRREGLFSFPSRYGVAASLRLAKQLHVAALLAFAAFGAQAHLGLAYWIGVGLTALALVWEHRLAASEDPRLINQAFFEVNALVSLTLLLSVGFHFQLWRLI
jgi:4-hydroxybenzoate polyprenyltransferase